MARTGIVDYIKEAFKVPYNLILLSGGFLAGIITFHPLAVWPIAAAIEIVYLLTLAQHPRFQNVVRARQGGRETAGSNVVAERLVATLSPDRRERFDRVRERCDELQRSVAQAGGGPQLLGDILGAQQTESVNKLLWAFLRALSQEQVLASFSTPARRKEIEDSLRRVEAELAKTGLSEAMRIVHTENQEVLKKRLENLNRADENLQSLRARLVRIENSILLIQEQALTRSDPSFIENEVKAATAGLDSSEEMLRMMELPALDTTVSGPPPEFLQSQAGRERG
jgi:hypothetical protein